MLSGTSSTIFPKQNLPKVYAYFSGFQAQTSVGAGYFGIGLEPFFRGRFEILSFTYSSIPALFIAFFLRRKILHPALSKGLPGRICSLNMIMTSPLLAKMIYNGKIMYFMDDMLPDVPDSIKIQYTKKQMDWARANESNIWGYFLDQNLLYETDYNKIKQFIDVGAVYNRVRGNQ